MPRARRRHILHLPLRGRRSDAGARGLRAVLHQPLRPSRQPLVHIGQALRAAARSVAQGRRRGTAHTGGTAAARRYGDCRSPCTEPLRRLVAARTPRARGHSMPHVRQLPRGIRRQLRGRLSRDAGHALHNQHDIVYRRASSPQPRYTVPPRRLGRRQPLHVQRRTDRKRPPPRRRTVTATR